MSIMGSRVPSAKESFVCKIRNTVASFQGARACLFTFHRAAPAEVWAELPDRNFYLNLAFLDELLGYLIRTGWIVTTIDEVARRSSGREDAPRLVNFSVDDCYMDTWQHVVPLFRKHGVPVTMFITTGIPDGTLSLSWSGLETIIADRGQVIFRNEQIDVTTNDRKRDVYKQLWSEWEKTSVEDEYQLFCAANDANPSQIRERHAITWEILESFRHDPCVEIGAHTVSHRRISSLSESDAFAEVSGSRERLRERLNLDVRHFAFPYGRRNDCGPRDFDLCRKAGFATASTTRKGLVKVDSDVFRLPRNTLNGNHQSIAMVEAALTGLTGIAASVLGRV